MTTSHWDQYVATFHVRRAGITESLLGACVDPAGRNPYEWLTEGMGDGLILDIGCGSSPTADTIASEAVAPPGAWIGIDRSREELARAVAVGRGPVIQGDAHALPFADDSVDAVLSSMSMMVLRDPSAATGETARVLRRGGTLRLLLPADRPLSVRDKVRYALLLLVLGRTAMPFPDSGVVADPEEILHRSAFEVLADERRCFRFTFDRADHPELFIESLYVPGVGRRRMSLARLVVRRWAHSRSDRSIALPLRRITARLRVI